VIKQYLQQFYTPPGLLNIFAGIKTRVAVLFELFCLETLTVSPSTERIQTFLNNRNLRTTMQ